MIDDNSYRNSRRRYLTENCTDIADFRQRWGGGDASSPQIADSRDSRHRGCLIVVILHDELE
ncbi:hypothetical protein [Rhizobium leguminosarum]